MRAQKYSFFLIFISLFLGVCCVEAAEITAPHERAPGIHIVSAEQASQLIRQREDLVVVDVRSARERRISAINNSLHIEMSDFQRNAIPLQPHQPVLLYCAVGGRSEVAAKWLKARGHIEIYNLAGGIVQWQRKGYETVRGK